MNDSGHHECEGVFHSRKVTNLAAAAIVVFMAFLVVQAIATLQNMNEPAGVPQNVITVSGEGKASAAPDIATVSFTVSQDAATVSAAQDAAAKKENAALAALKPFSIADKDIQTSSYNVYPKYSSPAPCVYNTLAPSAGVSSGVAMPVCPPTESKIIGYTASETVTIKIRNLDNVGKIVTALGGAGISNLSGPDFSIENPDLVQAAARDQAIANAKTKAEELANALGVRIIRVTNYSEGGGGYPVPMMYSKAAGLGGGAETAAPSVPTGENQVTVDVSITYEIR
ncbi:MAG: SIMPL domain-containing protein [Patescibacteria group bacterium]|nr:SIMPL domain-containing protein [Patescibacteria group bacterium]